MHVGLLGHICHASPANHVMKRSLAGQYCPGKWEGASGSGIWAPRESAARVVTFTLNHHRLFFLNAFRTPQAGPLLT